MAGEIDTQSIKGLLVVWNIHQMSYDARPVRSNTAPPFLPPDDRGHGERERLQAIGSITYPIP